MSPFDFKNTSRDEMRRPTFFVGSALVVLASVVYGFTHELTTTGYVMSVVIAFLVIVVLAHLVLFTEAPWWVRFVLMPLVTSLFIAVAALGGFGPLAADQTKTESVAENQIKTEPTTEREVTYYYTDKVTVLADCTPFEVKVPEGITVEARSQTDSDVARTTHCDVTINWSRYGVRAMPTKDGVGNLGDLDSGVNNEGNELTLTVPIGTRVDVFLHESGRPTQPVSKAMMALNSFEASR